MHRNSTIAEMSGLVRDRKLSPVALAEECLARIEALNPQLNAFITVTAGQALEAARIAHAEIAGGRWRGPMHGIPVGVKDFFDTTGIRTTGAFEPLRNRVPAGDAEIVARLKCAGAVIVGKTNMHTLGMGTTSVESCFGPVHNPWNAEYVAGGSSGGSAAAVAAGMCYATVDTDAIGSCRLPAACCGVAGFKPTFGLLSTKGVLEGEPADENTARMLALIGHTAVTCRTAEDAGLMMEALVAIAESREAQRVGVATNYKATCEVRSSFERAAALIRGLGYEVSDIEVPFARASFDVTNIERDREALDGTLFADIDLLIVPTLTDVPPRIEDVRRSGNQQAVAPDNTFFCNYFGLPAISLPCGFSKDGLPLGFQIVGPRGSDGRVLSMARSFQNAPGITKN